MKRKQILSGCTIVALVVFLLSSCNSKPANIDKILSAEEKQEIMKTASLSAEEGLAKLTTYCYSCHSPQSQSHDDMLAPPLAGIKYKYSRTYQDKTLFVSRMADFVYNPSKANALMKGPVRRFGLMPKVPLSKAEINELCLFIYEHELEVPAWFPAHFEEQHGKLWKDTSLK